MAVKPKDQIKQEKEAEEAGPEGIAEVSAIYSDTYYLNIWPTYFRITFGESFEEKVYYRQAVAMPIDQAEALAKDVLSLIKEYREEAEKNRAE